MGPNVYSLSITTSSTPILKNALLLLSGAVAASVLNALRRRLAARRAAEGRSTTSSAGGGASAYDTKRAVDEYLQFHFGNPEDVLPYGFGPKEALRFPAALAQLVERHCEALRDFTGERPEPAALDVGCAVGGACFELARAFPRVYGLDYSKTFVAAAMTMKERGWMRYVAVEEGGLTAERTALVAEDIERDRVAFVQGDACALPQSLGRFDAVLAANLLCRLPDPAKFVARLPSLVAPGGVLVLASPYSWLQAWTPQEHWLGGFRSKDGSPVWSADRLRALLSPDFDLVEESDLPFLIREHRRKFQWGVSHVMVWRRK